MISDQHWINKVRALPPERQREVLDFIEFLSQRERQPAPSRAESQSLRDLWADLCVDVDSNSIDEIRRQMWSDFPRPDLT